MSLLKEELFMFSLFLAGLIGSESNALQPTLKPAAISSLQFVAVVTRHGSRSPLTTFPNDPYPYTDRRFWPDGPGELSNLGKEQLFHTGKYLRSRYNGFISNLYNSEESEITYNPYNRDYMSAACLTASLFPPIGKQVWNPSLNWQPIVQSVREFDVCDLSSNNKCPRFMQLYNKVIDKFNLDTEKNKDLIKYVADNTGGNYTQLSDLYDVYDTLLMQAQNGYKLPQWTKKVFPFTIRPFAVTYLAETYSNDKEQLSLGAGPELKYISDILSKRANGTDKVKKLYIEAAHDCTLIVLLRAMGNTDPNLEIHTGAYIVFELHYLPPDYVVQIFYFKTPHDTNPDLINVTGCPNPCSLSNFNKFVNSINPPNWKKACRPLPT